MKDQVYAELICGNFCRYFKGGKEDLKCGGYELLAANFTPAEIRRLSDQIRMRDDIKNSIPADNKDRCNLVCAKCDFLIDGCDYRDNFSAPPCGGYILINELIRR